MVGATAFLVVRAADGTFAPTVPVQTDAQGCFRFEPLDSLLAEATADPCAPVQAPGWGWSFATFPEPEAEALVTLRPAADLRVSFLDPAGKPARGVRVKLVCFAPDMSNEYIYIPPKLQAYFLATTDAQGRGVFSNLPFGTDAEMEIDDARATAASISSRAKSFCGTI